MVRVVALTAALAAVWTMAAAQAAAAYRLPIASVVPGGSVTQAFGCTTLVIEPFDPYCPSRHFHSGVDLAAPEGTAVHSATAGQAVSGVDEKGCGLFVSVAYDEHVRVLYCHLHWAAFVSAAVTAGQVVGQVGSSGLATGAHLHLEVQLDGRALDPVRWLAAS